MQPRIIHRPGVGTTAGVLQKQELEFKRLFVDQPVLIVVERGIKALRWGQGEYIIRSGEAIAIAGGQTVDIINRLAEDGSYRAFWLVCDAALIAEHAQTYPAQPVIRHALPLLGQPGEFMAAFQRAVAAVEDETMPVDIARHRAAEMLLWIGAHGGKFAPAEALTVALKVRRLIGRDLALEWSAATVAAALAMSESPMPITSRVTSPSPCGAPKTITIASGTRATMNAEMTSKTASSDSHAIRSSPA